MIKAKSTIVLNFGPGANPQTSDIIDDDNQTSKEVKDGFAKLYTTSNVQAVLNLRNELESLHFKETESWETNLVKFHELLGILAAYDAAVNDDEKDSKLLRTLPKCFTALAMGGRTSDISLDNVMVAVEGELSRTLNLKKDSKGSNGSGSNPQSLAVSRVKAGSSFVKQGFIAKEKNDVLCYVCSKIGHYSNESWHRKGKNSGISHRGRG